MISSVSSWFRLLISSIVVKVLGDIPQRISALNQVTRNARHIVPLCTVDLPLLNIRNQGILF